MGVFLDVLNDLENVQVTEHDLNKTRLGKYINEVRRKAADGILQKRLRALVKRWQGMVELGKVASQPVLNGSLYKGLIKGIENGNGHTRADGMHRSKTISNFDQKENVSHQAGKDILKPVSSFENLIQQANNNKPELANKCEVVVTKPNFDGVSVSKSRSTALFSSEFLVNNHIEKTCNAAELDLDTECQTENANNKIAVESGNVTTVGSSHLGVGGKRRCFFTLGPEEEAQDAGEQPPHKKTHLETQHPPDSFSNSSSVTAAAASITSTASSTYTASSSADVKPGKLTLRINLKTMRKMPCKHERTDATRNIETSGGDLDQLDRNQNSSDPSLSQYSPSLPLPVSILCQEASRVEHLPPIAPKVKPEPKVRSKSKKITEKPVASPLQFSLPESRVKSTSELMASIKEKLGETAISAEAADRISEIQMRNDLMRSRSASGDGDGGEGVGSRPSRRKGRRAKERDGGTSRSNCSRSGVSSFCGGSARSDISAASGSSAGATARNRYSCSRDLRLDTRRAGSMVDYVNSSSSRRQHDSGGGGATSTRYTASLVSHNKTDLLERFLHDSVDAPSPPTSPSLSLPRNGAASMTQSIQHEFLPSSSSFNHQAATATTGCDLRPVDSEESRHPPGSSQSHTASSVEVLNLLGPEDRVQSQSDTVSSIEGNVSNNDISVGPLPSSRLALGAPSVSTASNVLLPPPPTMPLHEERTDVRVAQRRSMDARQMTLAEIRALVPPIRYQLIDDDNEEDEERPQEEDSKSQLERLEQLYSKHMSLVKEEKPGKIMCPFCAKESNILTSSSETELTENTFSSVVDDKETLEGGDGASMSSIHIHSIGERDGVIPPSVAAFTVANSSNNAVKCYCASSATTTTTAVGLSSPSISQSRLVSQQVPLDRTDLITKCFCDSANNKDPNRCCRRAVFGLLSEDVKIGIEQLKTVMAFDSDVDSIISSLTSRDEEDQVQRRITSVAADDVEVAQEDLERKSLHKLDLDGPLTDIDVISGFEDEGDGFRRKLAYLKCVDWVGVTGASTSLTSDSAAAAANGLPDSQVIGWDGTLTRPTGDDANLHILPYCLTDDQ